MRHPPVLPAAERCALRADLRGDPMLGTAFPAARLLLVEQPFPWGFEGLRSSRFARETALAVEAHGRTAGVRVQAIRRLGRSADLARRRWMLVDTRPATAGVRVGEFAEDAELLELPLDGSAGELHTDPLYLVCTHGQHDPCCGSRGRPLVAALSARRPEQVWQASHLGGCRFAATVLTLPSGLMYGRVPSDAADDLVTATDRGEVLPGLLRGRIGMSPPAQAAIGFAHERLGLPRSRDVDLRSVTVVDGGTVVVRLGTPEGEVDVTVRRTRVDAAGLTCGAPGPSAFLAHHPVAIAPAELQSTE